MRVLNLLAGLLYPPLCALCDARCPGAVCGACETKLELVDGEACRRCGAAILGRACGECRGREFVFARAAALGHYVGTFRGLVLRFKLGGQWHLARDLGRRLADRVLAAGLPAEVVVPVPMRKWAILGRGYNPAEELADQVAAALRRPFARALRKVRATKPQATLPLPERSTNPAGAYAVRKPASVRGRAALLVDDVLTTGATANECAKALLRAGASEVNLAVLAR